MALPLHSRNSMIDITKLTLGDRITRSSTGTVLQVTRIFIHCGELVVFVRAINPKTGKPWQRHINLTSDPTAYDLC